MATAANARREPKVKPGSIARKAERNCGKNCQREAKIGCWSFTMVLETIISAIIEKSYTILSHQFPSLRGLLMAQHGSFHGAETHLVNLSLKD